MNTYIGGYRLLPVPGQVFTELEAVNFWSGANAELFGWQESAVQEVLAGCCGTEKNGRREGQKKSLLLAHEPQFNLDSL